MEVRRPKRGFARLLELNPNRVKEIASMGGKKAHTMGRAHQYTKEEAQAYGKKGGLAVSRDREHMRRIGRKGGRNKAGFRTLHPQPIGEKNEGNDSGYQA